jgi:hypothetical protein
MTFADNGERNELRRLDDTGGGNNKHERRIWAEPFDPSSGKFAKIL